MKPLKRNTLIDPKQRPIKVLQFGTGNFLRGFPDYIIDLLNEKTDFNGNIQLVQPNGKQKATLFQQQEGLYHVLIRGYQHGEIIEEDRLITSVVEAVNPYLEYREFLSLGENPDLKLVLSNTTEAGIYFNSKDKYMDQTPESFPGKLASLLYHRFSHFKGDRNKGLTILPCELIDANGDKLKEIVLRYASLWEFSSDFSTWIKDHNIFCNTLVDCIVPGFPIGSATEIQNKLGYNDELMVMAEPYHFWAINGPESVKRVFPVENLGVNVKFVKDLAPYRTRKVAILNGAHTALVPVAYLRGIRLVNEAMEDPYTKKFLEKTIEQEIIPTLDQPEKELKAFAHDVMERFKNPFIKHQLSSIALNSISKFKVRVLPSLMQYVKRKEELPMNLVKSFSALIVFYKGSYKGHKIPLNDSAKVLDFFDKLWKIKDVEHIVSSVLARIEFWEQDLNLVRGLSTQMIAEVNALLEEERIQLEEEKNKKKA